ncbi:unnamed protein product [Durusdinium trenchii]|uniref:Phospholipid/glycerol acyltransferase domain-containing protein n=1 Tax=Durusdinium trenchii TaxID=1381693 RepID=A0ABP0M6G8_9DINO
MELKRSGIPALLAIPALLWFALCCTFLQALCLLLWAAGLVKEYTEAIRFLLSVMHRPFLYLMQYSGSRVFVYTAQGDVQSSILKTIGFDQSLIFSNHRGDLDWLIGLMVEDNGGGLGRAPGALRSHIELSLRCISLISTASANRHPFAKVINGSMTIDNGRYPIL